MTEMMNDPTFWVAVGFVLFVLILLWIKVPAQIAKALDSRSAAIAREIEEAKKLREEAQSLLAAYQRKQRDAEKEAEDIIVQARAEAERLAIETRAALEAQLARRTKMAEDKIAQAEAQAVNEVRALAAETAVAAARRVIAASMTPERAKSLLDASITAVKAKVN